MTEELLKALQKMENAVLSYHAEDEDFCENFGMDVQQVRTIIEREAGLMALRAYVCHEGEPKEYAILVFARTTQEAKREAYHALRTFSGCDYTQVRVRLFKGDIDWAWTQANQEKIGKSEAHANVSPDTCRGCERWGEALTDKKICEQCHEDELYDMGRESDDRK